MKKSRTLAGIVALCAVAFAAYIYINPASDDLFAATSRASAAKHFVVAFAPEDENFQHNTLHTWIAEIRSADGTPVKDANITINGGMPQHGHGLPTVPQMTEYLGAGRYKVEGMRFNMGGLWELNLAITAGDTSDTVTFNLEF